MKRSSPNDYLVCFSNADLLFLLERRKAKMRPLEREIRLIEETLARRGVKTDRAA